MVHDLFSARSVILWIPTRGKLKAHHQLVRRSKCSFPDDQEDRMALKVSQDDCDLSMPKNNVGNLDTLRDTSLSYEVR